MRTLKQHLNSIRHAMNPAQSAAKTQEIINATNISATSIAGMFPIGMLMDKITVSPGDRLPSNLAGISIVRDSSDDSRMWAMGEGAVGSDEEIGRYYLDIDHVPFSKVGIPFRSTGSIAADGKQLTCTDMIALATGAYLYLRKVGDTVYHTRVDANGDNVIDANGDLVLFAVPSSSFNPQLPGVRFYDSGESNNDEIVYYGENEELAYWNHSTIGWIITDMENVGAIAPAGYFDMTDDYGRGEGEWEGIFINFETIEESNIETVADDSDFADLIVCITNETYGDYYYGIISVNEDNTFNLSGTHPFGETDSVVTIFREATTRINFVDYSEKDITSGTYDVFYWTFPNPLTQDDDIIPFAYPDYLELMTIRRLPETKGRRPVSKTELEKAEAAARKAEPAQKPPSRPMTAQGSPFSMGSGGEGLFTVRGG